MISCKIINVILLFNYHCRREKDVRTYISILSTVLFLYSWNISFFICIDCKYWIKETGNEGCEKMLFCHYIQWSNLPREFDWLSTKKKQYKKWRSNWYIHNYQVDETRMVEILISSWRLIFTGHASPSCPPPHSYPPLY